MACACAVACACCCACVFDDEQKVGGKLLEIVMLLLLGTVIICFGVELFLRYPASHSHALGISVFRLDDTCMLVVPSKIG